MKKQSARSPYATKILEALIGRQPMSCSEIAALVGISHRHVRALLATSIGNGEAFMVKGTHPAR